MKLIASSFFNVAALLACFLLLAHHCAGGGGDQGASSLAATSPSNPRRVFRAGVPASQYMDKYLNERAIEALDHSSGIHPYLHENLYLPFYGTVPLFSVDTPPAAVAQALHDRNEAGIVDMLGRKAVLIGYHEGKLQQLEFDRPNEVFTAFTLDRNLHKLKRFVWGQVESPGSESVDGLPYFEGKPILIPNHQSFESMHAASMQDQKAFWYPLSRHKYLLIRPFDKRRFFEEVGHDKAAQIREARVQFERWRDSYGRGLAGVKWGRPLHLDHHLVASRPANPSIFSYNRFGSTEGTRQDMINAFKQHGRFRLYLNGRAQGGEHYTVRFRSPSPSHIEPGGNPISVEPLTAWEKVQEKASMIKLPAQVKHVSDITGFFH